MNVEAAIPVDHLIGSNSHFPAPEARPRVLVAEDQRSIWEALRLLLAHDYEIEFADHPAEALERLQSRPFDLLLMDLNYTRDTTSGREGLDLVQAVRQFDSGLPIVVMTAWGSIDLAVEALQLGASDFIQKPWDNRQLAKAVATQVTRGKSIRRHERLRKHELEEAIRIQQRLLPKSLPVIPGYGIAAGTEPAQVLGGDYFDVLRLDDDRLAFCIGDVAGKGMPAALLMANLQAIFRATASVDLPPDEVCRRMNRLLGENIDAERFASFFYGVLDLRTKQLSYCNAGHLPPLLASGDRRHCWLTEGGPVLGSLSACAYDRATIELKSGDQLVLFTDGLVEATDAYGQEFGEMRVLEVVTADTRCGAPELRARLASAASTHCTSSFDDDVTLMVIAVE